MQRTIRLRGALLLAVLVTAFAAIFVPSARAQAFHGASIQKNPVGPTGLPIAHVGDTITAQIRVRNVDDFNDSLTITSIVDVVHHTSGDETSPNLLPSPVVLANFGDFVTTTNTYLVLPGDPDVLQDDALAGGIDNHDGINGSGLAQDFFITFPGQIRVLKPCIRVVKNCVNGIGENGTITWSGMVTNCGNTPLFNVTVSNLVNGQLTLVFGPTTLNTNGFGTFSGSYPGNCSGTTDTLLARGTDELALTVTSSATATCSNIVTAGIAITKNCPQSATPPGGILSFSGIISNIGNVTLTNVVVVDNQPAANTPVVGPITLAPGAIFQYSGTYTTRLDNCGPWIDTVTVTARSVCGANVSANATATCAAITTPALRVTKTCPPSPTQTGGTLVFTGTVTNTGNITLTNVVVVNDKPTAGTFVFGPITLAPGAGTNFSGSYVTPLGDCGPYTDTLTATARSICGTSVTNTATATCPGFAVSSIVVTKTCPTAPVAPGGVLTFTGSVSNSGDVTVTNVVVVNNQPAPGTVVFGPITLTPGQSARFTNSYTVPANQCGPWIDTLTATARSLCGTAVTNTATAQCASVVSTGIDVTKTCVGGVEPGGLLIFSGSVSNTGNVGLTNVVVVNDQPTPGTIVFGPTNLAPGQVYFFTNSYRVPQNFCGPAVDTLTATARSLCGELVSDSATASCPVITKPLLRLTKECPPAPVAPGGLLTFTGSVSNYGNVTVTNILVYNNQPAAATLVAGPFALAPGQIAFFTNSYRVPLDACGPWVDTLSVTGRSFCSEGTIAIDSASATCPAVTSPQILVAKFCPQTATPPGGTLVFSGVVSNVGNITLTNVIVVNNQPAPGTVVFGPTNLAPGEVRFFSGSYVVPSSGCGPWVDTLTATGRSICGSNVTHSATATCPAVTTAGIDVTKTCVGGVEPGGLLIFTGSVSNTGNIGLTNVVVVNDQPTPGTIVFGPTNLAPGQVYFFTNSYRVPQNFCGPAVDTLTATARSLCGELVTDSATASCPVITKPLLRLTKECPPAPVAPGGLLTFTGSVSNYGNVTVTNILVYNNQPAAATLVAGPFALAPGQIAFFTNSYRVPLDACGPWVDTLSVTGRSFCSEGTIAIDSASATCPALIIPQIRVGKFCPEGATPPGGTLVFSGVVSNTGNITLTNVVVVNNQPFAGTIVFGPTNLAPGEVRFFSGSYVTPTNSCGPWVDTLTATARSICGSNVTHSATATCPVIVNPCVVVNKFCPPAPTAPGALIVYTGSVSNCGNIGLTNIVVTNDRQPGINVFGPTNLAPGQVYFFTNSYVAPANSCGPVIDNLFVSGNTLCGQPVTNFVNSACPIITTPAIRVTKSCPPTAVVPGGVLTFIGSVSNSGNISLTNVVVVNNQPVPNTVVFGPVTLTPGQSARFTNSYTTSPNQCGPWVDTLTGTARSICGVAVTGSATAICAATNTPAIRVTKSCPPTPTGPNELLVFSGTVSNAGNIILTNVTVINNQPVPNTLVFGPVTLQPGEVRSFSSSYRTPFDVCGPYSDTLTATARSICGVTVSNTATATCPGITTPRISITKSCPLTNTPFLSLLVYNGVVSNSGNVTLTNVIVVDDKPAPNTLVLGPITLAPGQFVRFTNSYFIGDNCCGPYADMLTASGRDKCTGSNVVKTATAVCQALTVPALSITRTCPTNPITLGVPITFSGIVSNSGTVVLSNVVVIGNNGEVIMTMPGFSPREWMDYTATFTITNCPQSGFVTNVVTITGRDICNGSQVTATAICIIACGEGKAPVIIMSPVITRQGFAVSFATLVGYSYTIQYTDSLNAPINWQTWTTVSGTGSVVTREDPATNPMRFYRVLCAPNNP